MNKAVRVILDIPIVIAGIAFLGMIAVTKDSFRYAGREKEDPVEVERRLFEYELRHRSYGEIMYDYYFERMMRPEPQPGLEDLYHVAEYAHAAFMSRVYAEKGDEQAVASNAAKRSELKSALGDYAYTADEVDEMIRTAPR